MARFSSIFLAFALLFASAAAFSVVPPTRTHLVASKLHQRSTSSPFTASSPASASVALQLKINVDEIEESDRINPAVFRSAIFVGGTLLALALPFFFLLK